MYNIIYLRIFALSIPVFLRRKMATKCIGEVGPWGGNGGHPWEFKLNGGKLTEIWIASGDYIDSIRFVYKDQNGKIHHSPKYGGDGGTMQKIIFQEEDEELKEMGGTTRDYVLSLYFSTKEETYEAHGRNYKGAKFDLPVANGKFVGFFGECGDLLDSIGAILQF